MKTTFSLLFVSVLLIGVALFAQDQAPAVTHNTWTSGTPIPTPVWFATAGLLKNQIYVVGGISSSGFVADVQVYNPATNAWSTGASYPSVIGGASAAVVSNILYVFGGTTNNENPSNAVWAYNPKTKAWTGKAALPTARWGSVAVVANDIVYVMGGYGGNGGSYDFLATVESYDPATDAWTEQAPMLVAKGGLAAGVFGTAETGYTIVAADGAINGGGTTGDTESYDIKTNTWTAVATDPNSRAWMCYGLSGKDLYDIGDYSGGGAGTTNESFSLSADKWTTTLAPIPQGTAFPASAVYKKQLYCIGGFGSDGGSPINNVQIYQP